jgi:putative DNA primase/helicase
MPHRALKLPAALLPADVPQAHSSISLVPATDVTPKPPSYFWPPGVAFGKLSIVLASTATCTSALIAEFAAKATVGGELPQTQGSVPIGDTAILAADGTVAERIRPQLDAAGADLNRIHFFGAVGNGVGVVKNFDPTADFKSFSTAVRANGSIKLVLVELTVPRIDAGMVENYKATFATFCTIAREQDLAVVLLLHPAGNPMARSQIAAAINVLSSWQGVGAVGFVTRENAGGRWLLVWAKNIVGHDAPGIAFQIEAKIMSSGVPAAVIVWDPKPVAATKTMRLLDVGGESSGRRSELQRAKDFFAAQIAKGPVKISKIEKRAAAVGINKATLTRARKELGIEVISEEEFAGAVKEAKDFLLAVLANSPVAAKAIERKAAAVGISKASLRRARKALKIKVRRKGGFAGKGRWVWRLRRSKNSGN